MPTCDLDYIPEYLHWGEKDIINDFGVDESLYWRVEKFTTPFAKISLSDISFNRSGSINNILSKKSDVLWNINPEDPEEQYDSEIITLKVLYLNFDGIIKTYTYPEDSIDPIESVDMSIIHDPCPCNYAHSVLRFHYEDQHVTFNNYNEGFGSRRPKGRKMLRQVVRDDLQKAFMRSINND